jgi:DNA repair protein RadA/Sms
MPKASVRYVCQECGYEAAAYLGKCPECQSWNSLKEFRESKHAPRNASALHNDVTSPKRLTEVSLDEQVRMSSGFQEVDMVLGGGIVRGSVVLLAGDPGIGKSTLLLQIALAISAKKGDVLYISGEESPQQITLRAKRLISDLGSTSLELLAASDTDQIIQTIEHKKPSFVVVDSIQTIESQSLEGLAGSVGQVRYSAMQLIRIAKSLSIPIIIIGHVTKEGMVAGPMVLSHMVDVVLFLEGEKTSQVRLLRSLKNRFGPVDEVGVLTMDEKGMREVTSPEELFVSPRIEGASGSVLSVIMEGSRPFLVEIQSLAVASRLPLPRRVVSGVDQKRVELLLAVLQKQCRLPVDSHDIFINIAGGMKISDRAVDMAICLAVYSSITQRPMMTTVAMGEVGLLGEIRQIGALDKRIRETQKLGFEHVFTPSSHRHIRDVIGGLA